MVVFTHCFGVVRLVYKRLSFARPQDPGPKASEVPGEIVGALKKYANRSAFNRTIQYIQLQQRENNLSAPDC
jgi:hypothetical protein